MLQVEVVMPRVVQAIHLVVTKERVVPVEDVIHMAGRLVVGSTVAIAL